MFLFQNGVCWLEPVMCEDGSMPDTVVAPPPFPGRGGGHENGGGSRGGAPAIGLFRDPEHYEEINVICNGKFILIF
jgi:hypothetical protein